MVELVLLACLLKEPSRCERHYLPVEETMGVAGCAVTGQFRVVQWSESHPGWRVRRWACGMPRA